MSPLWPNPDPVVESFDINVRHPKAEGYNILINHRWYRTIAGPENLLQFGTRDSLAERQDRAGSIYENVLDIGYAWARTDLSGGEGLDWDPRELALDQDQAALDKIRYWDSNGIAVRRPNTAGEQYTLRLARSIIDWAGVSTNPTDMGTSDSFIYIADGAIVSWYESWENTTAIGSDTLPSDIRAIAVSPNDTVVVTLADGNAWAKRSNEAVFVLIYNAVGLNLEAQGIWYVNGRFIMSVWDLEDEAVLISVEWNGTDWTTTSVIDTASAPFWSCVESGPAIVSACGDGTVRSYTPEQDGTMQLIPRARTTMPKGESAILLGSNAAVLLVMTAADQADDDRQVVRLYQAEVLSQQYNYSVGQLQLRREWQAVEHEPLVIRNMTNSRDEIFWFVKEELDGIFQESLWRFDIVTNGLSRVASIPDTNFNALVVFNETLGAIDYDNNKISISDRDHRQTSGWMIFPNITFGLNTDITWLTSLVEAFNLSDSGAQVEIWRSTDPKAILDWQDPTWIMMQRLSAQGASNIEIELKGVKSRTLALQLRIFATQANSESPQVSRIAMRGIPAHRDFIMMVPINVSDYVSANARVPTRIPGLGDTIHRNVMNLVGDSVEATVLDPPIGFRGIVNNVSETVQFVSDRGSVATYVMVEFRGQLLPSTAPPTGDSGVGLGWLGIATVGLGQSYAIEEETV